MENTTCDRARRFLKAVENHWIMPVKIRHEVAFMRRNKFVLVTSTYHRIERGNGKKIRLVDVNSGRVKYIDPETPLVVSYLS